MRKTEGPLCRLCLGVVSNANIGEIVKNIKGMLDVFQLKLKFHSSEEDIVCSDCMRSIQECLDFKLAYQNVEDFIVALYSKSKSKLDLREVYIWKNKHMTTTGIASDQEVCRFCMKLNNISSCNPLITIEDMMQKCIPELNFNFTKEPVICDSCLNSLKIYFQFLQICVDTEEKIMKYLEFEATGREAPINLNKVVQFAKTISDNERDVTKINVYSDRLCCETNENNAINTEVRVKKEKAEFDTENFENDNKTSVEENIKIELKEESGVLHNGELEMIYEHNEIHNLIKSEVAFEKESAKFESENVENYIKSNVEENILNMEIKVESLELQNKKLEMIDEQNELQVEHIDFESFQDAPTTSRMKTKNTLRSNVIRHLLTHQEFSGVKLYSCDLCSFKSKFKTSLKRHVARHHSVVKRYQCEKCFYLTNLKENLKRHMLIHQELSEEQVYKCDHCPIKAKHKRHLEMHVKLMHSELSEVKVYECEFCSFVTKHRSSLWKHKLSHQELRSNDAWV